MCGTRRPCRWWRRVPGSGHICSNSAAGMHGPFPPFRALPLRVLRMVVNGAERARCGTSAGAASIVSGTRPVWSMPPCRCGPVHAGGPVFRGGELAPGGVAPRPGRRRRNRSALMAVRRCTLQRVFRVASGRIVGPALCGLAGYAVVDASDRGGRCGWVGAGPACLPPRECPIAWSGILPGHLAGPVACLGGPHPQQAQNEKHCFWAALFSVGADSGGGARPGFRRARMSACGTAVVCPQSRPVVSVMFRWRSRSRMLDCEQYRRTIAVLS